MCFINLCVKTSNRTSLRSAEQLKALWGPVGAADSQHL